MLERFLTQCEKGTLLWLLPPSFFSLMKHYIAFYANANLMLSCHYHYDYFKHKPSNPWPLKNKQKKQRAVSCKGTETSNLTPFKKLKFPSLTLGFVCPCLLCLCLWANRSEVIGICSTGLTNQSKSSLSKWFEKTPEMSLLILYPLFSCPTVCHQIPAICHTQPPPPRWQRLGWIPCAIVHVEITHS